MTDSPPNNLPPTLADLQERLRAVQARIAELEADEEVVELIHGLITDTAALLAGIEHVTLPTTPTSTSRALGEDDDELQSLVARLRGVLESIAEVRPAQLFAGLDRKIAELDRFQRDLQPVKTKVDELVQVVGGRHGYQDFVEGFERLNQRIKVLAGVVVVLAVVAVISLLV